MNNDITTFSVKSNVVSHSDFAQDDRFMHVKLSLCNYNQKANGMHFGKELLESKMKEIDFMPIVGAIKVVEKDDGTVKYALGSHEVELDIVDNELVYKKNTIVLGVALPNTAKFETISRHDETDEYITFEALLFQEKYPQLKSIIDISTDASMELDNVEADYDEDKGWYDVKNYRTLAHCLIGVPPAFRLAGVVQQFNLDDFKLEFSDVLEEIKSSLNRCNNTEMKGGDDVEEIKVDEFETEVLEQEVEVEVETDPVEDIQVESQETEEALNQEEVVEEVKEDEFVQHLTQQEKDCIDNKLSEYESLVNKFSKLEKEYKEISEKYQAKVNAEEMSKKQEIIASYSDSLTEEEISDVVKDINVFSVEEVDVKLAALLGKKTKQEKYAQKEQPVFSNLNTNFSSKSKWDDWLKKMN